MACFRPNMFMPYMRSSTPLTLHNPRSEISRVSLWGTIHLNFIRSWFAYNTVVGVGPSRQAAVYKLKQYSGIISAAMVDAMSPSIISHLM